MKKFTALILTAGCVFFLFACGSREETQAESDIQQETEMTDMQAESETAAETEKVVESELGYRMTYNPTAFTLDDAGELDIYTYSGADASEAPVYMSVQRYPDMDAQTLAEGLALQSGMDDVEVQDIWFGADGLESKNVYIEREVEGVTQIQIFYAVPMEEGSLLLEIGSYLGVAVTVDGYFEEMLGTFSLVED